MCAFIALLYLIASIVVASIAKYKGVYGAAAVNKYLNKRKSNFYFVVFRLCSYDYLFS